MKLPPVIWFQPFSTIGNYYFKAHREYFYGNGSGMCVTASDPSWLSGTPAAHLELQHQVQSMLPQGVDLVDNQCYNNVDAIWLVLGDASLTRKKKDIVREIVQQTTTKKHYINMKTQREKTRVINYDENITCSIKPQQKHWDSKKSWLHLGDISQKMIHLFLKVSLNDSILQDVAAKSFLIFWEQKVMNVTHL